MTFNVYVRVEFGSVKFIIHFEYGLHSIRFKHTAQKYRIHQRELPSRPLLL